MFQSGASSNGRNRNRNEDDDERLPTDGPMDIHEKLQTLHRNEVIWLGKNESNARTANAAERYFHRVALDTTRYIRFVIDSWWGLFLTTFFGGLGPFDWFSMFFFAFGGTILLFVVLVFCTIVNSPLLVKIYFDWSNKKTGGLGLVNNANPNLFNAMTISQVVAGKEALSQDISESKDTETYRQFNLDRARFLLQLAAVVYEHPNQAIRKAVSIAAKSIQTNPGVDDDELINAAPTAAEEISSYDSGIPPARPYAALYNYSYNNAAANQAFHLAAAGLSRVGTTVGGLASGVGSNLNNLNANLGVGVGLDVGLDVDGINSKLGAINSELNSAVAGLASDVQSGVTRIGTDAYAAGTRLGTDAYAAGTMGVQKLNAVTGDLVDRFLGTNTKNEIAKALDMDGPIHKFCTRIGIEFEPLSELNNTSSAFSGLFWDPKSNWIVVAFKGTQPIEFSEWLSDFNAKMTHCGTHVQGFRKVHKGFKERVYPEDVSSLGNVRPYDTISLGIKTLAKHLRLSNKFPAEKTINVWFTGHSLGCATSTLVYSRFLMRHNDMGKKSVLRDAYLFAAPIVCDRDTVEVFNAKMMEDKKRPKTMWRITSNGDVVATCLPEFGDYTSLTVSPNNAFAFAHLGTEIKLADHPTISSLTGNHIFYGTRVDVVSKFSPLEVQAQLETMRADPKEREREKLAVWVQRIPVLGRVLAHGTVFYWDQLNRIGLGKCKWAYN